MDVSIAVPKFKFGSSIFVVFDQQDWLSDGNYIDFRLKTF
jgi:hypothetical protein